MTGRGEPAGGAVTEIEVAVGDGVRRPVRLAVALIAVALAGGLSLVWLLGSSGDDREGLSPASASSSTSVASSALTSMDESTVAESTLVASTVADSTGVATGEPSGGGSGGKTRVVPPGSLLEWCLGRMASPPAGWSGCLIDKGECQSLMMGPVVLKMPDMRGWSRGQVGDWTTLVSVTYPSCTSGQIPLNRIPATPTTCTANPSQVDRVASQNLAPGTTATGIDLTLELSYFALCAGDPPATSEPTPPTEPAPTDPVPTTEA